MLPIVDASITVQLFALRRASDERPLVLAFLDCLRAVYRDAAASAP